MLAAVFVLFGFNVHAGQSETRILVQWNYPGVQLAIWGSAGSKIIGASSHGVRIFDAIDGKQTKEFYFGRDLGFLHTLQANRDGSRILVVGGEGLLLLDADSGKILIDDLLPAPLPDYHFFFSHAGFYTFSEDGFKLLAVRHTESRKTMVIWNAADGMRFFETDGENWTSNLRRTLRREFGDPFRPEMKEWMMRHMTEASDGKFVLRGGHAVFPHRPWTSNARNGKTVVVDKKRNVIEVLGVGLTPQEREDFAERILQTAGKELSEKAIDWDSAQERFRFPRDD